MVGFQEDELHAGIFCGHVDGLDCLVEAYGRDWNLLLQHRHRICGLFLLGNGYLREVYGQHSALGEHHVAIFAGERTGHPAKDEQYDEIHDENAADHGKKHFEKLFHSQCNSLLQI